MQNMSVQVLAQMRAQGVSVCVVDVREDWERALVCIEGSVHIPLGQLPAQVEILKSHQNTPVVAVCHHGVRSQRAALFLASVGFSQVFSLEGGVDAWASEIDPSLARY